MRTKSAEQYEAEIKELQKKLAVAKKLEGKNKVSHEVKRRLKSIMENKCVELTFGEIHYIVNPLVNLEESIYRKNKKEA